MKTTILCWVSHKLITTIFHLYKLSQKTSLLMLGCAHKCELICSPLVEIAPTYFVCLNNRNKRCSPLFSASTDNCVAECDLIKFIDINNSVRGLATHVMNSCLQECRKKK
ncbi:hypothetical protein GmHk_02G003739 [Glycine max]|nr:hypothetical protein GmHk_02G003739 [Glycine max]